MFLQIIEQSILVLLAGSLIQPQPAWAQEITYQLAVIRPQDQITEQTSIDPPPQQHLPTVVYGPPVQQVLTGHLYAYASTPSQTQGNPFITASGERVAWGIVANNCLAFGTVIKIPAIFGDQEFRVQDRMAARYDCNSFDIWYPNTAQAIQFGKRTATIEVY